MPRQKSSTDSGGRGASVIENAVAVLRCFSPDRQELGVTEIAPKVGLHKSSVSRILASLEREGIVEQGQSRRYRLGLGIIAIAGPLLADLDVRRASYPILQDLTAKTGETSALMVWNGTESITVEQIPSSHEVKHTSSLGSRYGTALSASVQVFLADEDPGRIREMIADGAITASGQDDTGLDIDGYLSRLEQVAETGVAVNCGETSSAAVGIAAPVKDHRGVTVAAILIPAPRFRVGDEAVERLSRICVDAARQVTKRLGGS
ncbi:IclR family transcriptional regulator [Brevibacterium zhoupengii]|uniref:IclR family transcriptional regulator n=1 Tax=Brevibacterium zhoupengii TaxID=2898795 RepID=UPI001E482DED|nr:IclR family transcriptional regulator [Brevibacterium zhoupengii]